MFEFNYKTKHDNATVYSSPPDNNAVFVETKTENQIIMRHKANLWRYTQPIINMKLYNYVHYSSSNIIRLTMKTLVKLVPFFLLIAVLLGNSLILM